MLTSITPLGEWGRGQRYVVTITAFLVGGVVGGAAFGAVVALAGSAVVRAVDIAAEPRLAVFAAAIGAGLVIDLMNRNGRLPGPVRQVSQAWLDRYRGWVYGIGFGVQLGFAVTTIVTTAMVYVMLAGIFLTANLSEGVVIGAVFGLIRGGTALAAAGVRDPERLRVIGGRLQSWMRPALRLAAAVEAGILVLVALNLAA
jgi:hypothetical protein